MTYANPKKYGYVNMALSPELRVMLDEIMKEELCVSKAEALRRLVSHWRKTRSPPQITNNAIFRILARLSGSIFKLFINLNENIYNANYMLKSRFREVMDVREWQKSSMATFL